MAVRVPPIRSEDFPGIASMAVRVPPIGSEDYPKDAALFRGWLRISEFFCSESDVDSVRKAFLIIVPAAVPGCSELGRHGPIMVGAP